MSTVTVLPNAPTSAHANAIRTALKTSLYPGASDESVDMVLAYCQAGQFDPMTKPVHIVPMYDSKTKKYRDVIMPGIGLYRIQAARTGQYAGVSEPEYGPDTTADLDGTKVTFPAWCKIVVKRILPDGTIAEFAAIERWTENYATARNDTSAPNSMWKKRPYAQLAKCAEAQALRKAFPEIGAQPTAEEMEGKELDADSVSVAQHAIEAATVQPTELPAYPPEKLAANIDNWRKRIESGNSSPDQIVAMVSSRYQLSDEQKAAIFDLAPINVDSSTGEILS